MMLQPNKTLLVRIALFVACVPIISSWAWTTSISSSTPTKISNSNRFNKHQWNHHRMMSAIASLRSQSNRHSRCKSVLQLKLSESSNNSDKTSNDPTSTTASLSSSSLSAAPPVSDAAVDAAAAAAAADSATESPLLESTISSAWVSSFDEAGRSLVDEDNNQRIAQMGDFDANPAYKADRMEQMRAAIQARTASLGLEKSKISQQLIEEARERALARAASSYGGSMLDLSQITTASTPGNEVVREELPEGLPSMFYEPEELMSDEEKLEADPDSQLSVLEQGSKELQYAKWPTFWSALREVGVILLVIALSAALIIGWDRFLRDVYTDWGLIPRPEDVLSGRSLDGLNLPDGWTNNMSDQDMARLENEMSKLNLVVPPPPSTTTIGTTLPPLTSSDL